MQGQASTIGLVQRAAMKLHENAERWRNLLAFLRSCYTGRVLNYNFEDALAALRRLTDQEQHALIAWVVFQEERCH